jgi:hypothetical protein
MGLLVQPVLQNELGSDLVNRVFVITPPPPFSGQLALSFVGRETLVDEKNGKIVPARQAIPKTARGSGQIVLAPVHV